MLTVGLTGSVASGKSTVARIWAARGIPVVSADDLAREVVEPGSRGLERVAEAFGAEVLTEDGALDREAMRERVFGDPEARRRLESILHPLIAERRDAWLEARRAEGAELVVAEIPLLFEVDGEDDFDVTVVVDAPRDERLRRLTRERGLDGEEARSIMDAQMDPAEKRRRADVVLENDGSLDALERAALDLLEELRREAGEDGSGSRLRIDLHMHTLASRDCLSDPEAVLERALAVGLDRIAVTDHDRLGAALEMHRRHPERIIPGEEVKTAEGVDVIGLYLSEEIPKGTPAEETCRRIREQGGIVYLPHPYAPGKGGSGELAEVLAPLLHVVEVFNARIHDQALNRKAGELARSHGLPGGAGSDAHTLGEVGRAFAVVPDHPNEPGALLEALRSARIEGSESPRRVHLWSTWAKIRKRLPGAPSLDTWKRRRVT